MPENNDKTIAQDLQHSTAEIENMLAGVSDAIAGKKPAPGKWNILEILEHLNISDRSAYIAILRTEAPPTAAELAAKEERFIQLSTASNLQLVAPPGAEPKGKFKNLADALDNFLSVRKKIAAFAEENDLDLLAKGFEHPRLGYLTRSQWLRFLSWHVRHHGKQIANILNG